MGLNSKYSKEITIEIGGNSTKLKTALDQANRVIRTSQSELRTLQNSLKLEWNADNFKRAQELSQRALEQTRLKAEALRKAMAELKKQGTGEDTEQYQALRRELSYVEVAAQKAQRQLEELNSTRLDKLVAQFGDARDRLNAMGGTLTRGVTLPLAALGAASVNYASDTEEAVNKVEVAFQGAADEVKRWSDTTLTAYGLAKGTALDMAALFGDMATSMGLSREEAARMSQTLVGLAGDLASFKNIGVEQAQTALTGVFTGETESLKALGVVMTQANLEAYALAQGYKTAYTAMDQAQQVAVRYQYVLEMTRNAQGDFARTSDSTANQLRILRESLKEAAATAGDELLPVVTPIISNLAQLTQRFGDLDEGIRKAVVQTALFVAALGPALKITGSISGVISSAVTVYKALRSATTAATAAQTGLNVAMSANPIGAVVTAVGALVAVLASFAATAALTAERQDRLTDSVEKSRQAYQENAAELREQREELLSTVSALERLAETETKTSAQKAAMLEMVEQLNEAVPSLALAYDRETDSLNLTTEAIRRQATAMAEQEERAAAVERLSAAYAEQAELAAALKEASTDLELAKARLAEVEERRSQLIRDGTYETSNYVRTEAVAAQQLLMSQQRVTELTEALEDNQAEVAQLEGEYGRLTDALQEQSGAAGTAASQFDLFTGILQQVEERYGILRTAQDEMTESGYLSLDTVKELISAYPDLLGYLEAAEGGYRLTQGALESYIAAQRAEYELALTSAQDAADAIVTAEADKLRAINATTLSAKEQLTALANLYQAMGANTDNQAEGASYYRLAEQYREAAREIQDTEEILAGFDRVIASLNRDSGTVTKTSTTSTDNAGTDAFREAVEELDYLREMDRLSQEDYYRQLEALRDRCLEEDSDQWRSVTTELYQWRKARGQEAYQEELADLQYFLDMEIISEEEYYRRMASLRDQYLERDSDAWRQANVEIYSYMKRRQEDLLAAQEEAMQERLAALEEALDRERDALRDRYDQELDDAKAAYEEKKAQIQQELDLEKERLNTILEGIDQEIQARRELREDQEQDDAIAQAQKRLDAAKAQLSFARTDQDRAEWEKEVIRLEEALAKAIQDKEDTQFYREKEGEREAVQDQISAAEEKADGALDAAEAEYEALKERLEEEYEAAVSRLEAEYAAAAQRLQQSSSGGGSSGGSSGGRTYSDEVLGIAREQGVSLSDAQDMWEANQRNQGREDLPYYAGAELAGQIAAERAMAQAAGAAAAAAASVVNNTTRNNTASLTFNTVSALTEGQIARSVERVLDKLSK